jgi:hypothetical protein
MNLNYFACIKNKFECNVIEGNDFVYKRCKLPFEHKGEHQF